MPDNQVELTHTNVDVDNTTTEVAALNTDRKYLRVQNDDAALIVWLKVAAVAVASEGIRLGPGEDFEMRRDKNNLDNRAVNAIASAVGPAAVLVTQA